MPQKHETTRRVSPTSTTPTRPISPTTTTSAPACLTDLRQVHEILEPRSEDYRPDDNRWRDQLAELVAELRRQVDVEQRGVPVAGTKGALDELVVALGSAGVFTATVECLRAWLGRDRSRRIDIRWEEDGTERHVTLIGEAIDVDSVREIAKAAAQRIGGPEWPASTAPC